MTHPHDDTPPPFTLVLDGSGPDKSAHLESLFSDGRPASERRVALVIAPAQANDAVAILAALGRAGYRVDAPPADGRALTAALRAADETLALPDYHLVLGGLPQAVRVAIRDRWGPPEGDPLFSPGELDCGRFRIPAARFGHVAVMIPPAESPDQAPSHGRLAADAWARESFRADALVYLGGRDQPE